MKRYVKSSFAVPAVSSDEEAARALYQGCKHFLDREESSVDCGFHNALYKLRLELLEKYPCVVDDGWVPEPSYAPSLSEVED